MDPKNVKFNWKNPNFGEGDGHHSVCFFPGAVNFMDPV